MLEINPMAEDSDGNGKYAIMKYEMSVCYVDSFSIWNVTVCYVDSFF